MVGKLTEAEVMASNNITFPSYQRKSIRFDHWTTVLYDISWWINSRFPTSPCLRVDDEPGVAL